MRLVRRVPQTVSNHSSTGRRPTKAERKEQARLERGALQRKMAATKRNRTIGIALVGVALVAVVAAVVIVTPGGLEQRLAGGGGAARPGRGRGRDLGCDAVQTTEFYDGFDQAHPTTPTRRTSGGRAVPDAATARHLSEHAAGLGTARGIVHGSCGRLRRAPRPRPLAALAGARGRWSGTRPRHRRP